MHHGRRVVFRTTLDPEGEVMAMMGWYFGGTGWVMMIANVIFGGSLIVAAAWAVIRLTPGGGPVPRHDDSGGARDILDRRFAAGEIDAQEYLDAVRVLALERTR